MRRASMVATLRYVVWCVAMAAAAGTVAACGGDDDGGGDGGAPDAAAGDVDAGGGGPDGSPVPTKCPDPLEPNDTRAQAADLPGADTPGFEICQDDDDWFRFTPSQAETLYVVGHDSVLAAGDLDSDLVGADEEPLGYSWIYDGQYHPEAGVGPTNLEIFTVVGAPAATPLWLHVYGWQGATNTYGLVSRTIAWRDGPDCEAFFTRADCRAQTSGAHDPTKLIPFPVGVAWDPYIGVGVNTLSGLSYPQVPFTPVSRLHGRRELLMIIRHAIHEVRVAFPGTAPLGLGDVSMPDGTTPEGHPNGTHYEGANIDIAYYIRPDVHRSWGNMAYRQICCDATSLSDWSCVNTSSGSPGYGVCVDGSEATHIVDLPRTAMLIAKIAGSGRLRVIGVEAKIKPALEQALDDLAAQGKITAYEKSAALARMASKDDHPSWLWHFNHMHASFCRNNCGTSKPGQEGPWPDLPLDEQTRRAEAFHHRR